MHDKSCAVSVDLDTIDEYRAVHGVASPGDDLVYGLAIERIVRWAADEALPLTFFAIGRDACRPQRGRRLRELSAAGHAIESHSFAHRYDLSRLDRRAIADDLQRANDAIEAATGRVPRCFRAPGYVVSDALFDALESVGIEVDSSVFPCPAYYLAKLGALGAMTLLARNSASIIDTPHVLSAPADPYRPGSPWHRRGKRDLLELPIGVTSGLRLPFIGTALAMLGSTGARLLAAQVRRPVVSLELHAIDFLDTGDGLEALASRQPDLHVPWRRKTRAFSAAVRRLREGSHEARTVAAMAEALRS